MSIDFSAALDPQNPRCMVHPKQRLLRTSQIRGRTFMSCPVCNTEIIDAIAQRPDVVTITFRGD
jgi:hypothetical protein